MAKWIVVATYHERNSFNQEINYFVGSFEEAKKEFFYDNDEIEDLRKEGWCFYCDRSCDSTKVYDEEHLPYIRKHIENTTLIKLSGLKKEKFLETFFCWTKNKYGMFDLDKEAVNGDKN